MNLFVTISLLVIGTLSVARAQVLRQPIPDKVVVLTFDDASVTHATVVAPILKKYGFGGTFFVCEFPPDFADKTKYLSWEQIQQLDRMGFEIANHTLTHKAVSKLTKAQFRAELDSIEARCQTRGIARPVTFAYPGYDTHPNVYAVLKEKDYLLARVGGSRPYDPTVDHPYLIPSYSMAEVEKPTLLAALGEAKGGKVVVLTVHGVPDYAHDWVTTAPALFEEYMKYLHDNHYTVISLRNLATYINVPQALATIPLKP